MLVMVSMIIEPSEVGLDNVSPVSVSVAVMSDTGVVEALVLVASDIAEAMRHGHAEFGTSVNNVVCLEMAMVCLKMSLVCLIIHSVTFVYFRVSTKCTQFCGRKVCYFFDTIFVFVLIHYHSVHSQF